MKYDQFIIKIERSPESNPKKSQTNSALCDPKKSKIEANSRQSSVFKLKTKNLKILQIINQVKSLIPRSLYFLFVCIFLELILFLIYLIVVSSSLQGYFQNLFNPIQTGIIQFGQKYSSFLMPSSVIMCELEYQFLNITETNLEVNDIFYRILNRSFYTAKNIISQVEFFFNFFFCNFFFYMVIFDIFCHFGHFVNFLSFWVIFGHFGNFVFHVYYFFFFQKNLWNY